MSAGRWYVPTGRTRRSVWWLRYVLALAVAGVLAALLDAQLFPQAVPQRHPDPDGGGVDLLFWYVPERGGPVTAAVAIALVVPNVAALVTRLHDRDHSAWWLLWLLLGPVGVLVLGCTAGLLGTQPRPNRYGPPPPG